MKIKRLRVTMPGGSQWDVPLGVIAARKVAAKIPDASASEFQPALQRALLREDELVNWALNNLRWQDVSAYAARVEVPQKETDFNEGWSYGNREIVEA